MAEKDAKIQDIEDVEIEDLQAEDEEPVSSVYVLAGKAFSISKDSQKTIDMLSEQLREALPDTGQRLTDMGRIVDRVQTLMSTNFRDIRSPRKLKEKAKSLRTTLRRRITELSKKILPKLEEIDPPQAEVGAKIEALNEARIELQRLLTDEAALTLILRRDMTDDEATIPKKELAGCLVAAELEQFLHEELQISKDRMGFFCDSEVCLFQLTKNPSYLQPFTTNRVEKIQAWGFSFQYVNTCDNPADICSRGCDALTLNSEF